MQHVVLDTDSATDPARAIPPCILPVLGAARRVTLIHSLFDRPLDAAANDPNGLADEARQLLVAARGRQLGQLGGTIARRVGAVITRARWAEHRWAALDELTADEPPTLVVGRRRGNTGDADHRALWEFVRYHSVPVLLLPANPSARGFSRVLAAIDPPPDRDSSTLEATILSLAAGLGDQLSLPVSVLSVEEDAGARSSDARRRTVEALAGDAGLSAHRCVVMAGNPVAELTAAATPETLLVMGALSRSAARNPLIGTTTEQIAVRPELSILLVPPRAARASAARRPAGATEAART